MSVIVHEALAGSSDADAHPAGTVVCLVVKGGPQLPRDPFATYDIAGARDELLRPQQGVARTTVAVPETYREVDVFGLLLWRFGRPNGFTSLVGPPGGEA